MGHMISWFVREFDIPIYSNCLRLPRSQRRWEEWLSWCLGSILWHDGQTILRVQLSFKPLQQLLPGRCCSTLPSRRHQRILWRLPSWRQFKATERHADCKSDTIDEFLVAIGILYYWVTGSYWQLIASRTKYLDFYQYAGMGHRCNDTACEGFVTDVL